MVTERCVKTILSTHVSLMLFEPLLMLSSAYKECKKSWVSVSMQGPVQREADTNRSEDGGDERKEAPTGQIVIGKNCRVAVQLNRCRALRLPLTAGVSIYHSSSDARLSGSVAKALLPCA